MKKKKDLTENTVFENPGNIGPKNDSLFILHQQQWSEITKHHTSIYSKTKHHYYTHKNPSLHYLKKKKIHHFFFSFLFLEYLFGLYKWPFCLRWARSFLSLLLLFGCLPMEVAIVVSESRFLTFENKVSVKPSSYDQSQLQVCLEFTVFLNIRDLV